MIVNADDFGLDQATNRGVAAAFDRGLISSATVMANQPGFDEAAELVHQLSLHRHVGVHLVLTEGRPLTEAIRRRRRFCDQEGMFGAWTTCEHVWHFDAREREAVRAELGAQVDRARSAGLPITHLDSHHHVHNEWAVISCVIAVARAYEIPCVRIARNCGPGIRATTAAYKRFFNLRLRRAGLARTRWFGEISDWSHLRASGASAASLDDFEVMIHPTLDPTGSIIDSVSAAQGLEELLAPIGATARLISYDGANLSARSDL